MWLAQFHVNRFQRDVDLAAGYGCQGMLGIHWRHRIVNPTATFFARAMWDKNYEPAAHFAAYARSQASGERARPMGKSSPPSTRNRSCSAPARTSSKTATS